MIARNPFGRRSTMPATLDNDNHTDDSKAQAIINHHFQGSHDMRNTPLHKMKGHQVEKERLVADMRKALSATNSNSAPGPDRISYRLLKEIKETKLGEQTLGILADFLTGRRTILLGKGDGREVTVVMIPKEGKDLTRAKGWRPIMLINCLLKLMDKVVANELQNVGLTVHIQAKYQGRDPLRLDL